MEEQGEARVAEIWFTVYTFNEGSEGGKLVAVKSGLESEEVAQTWINEEGKRKTYYVIIKNYRKQ